MRWWTSLVLCWCACAGPVDFGFAEFNAALASRNLRLRIKTELTLDPPETYRIETYKAGPPHIAGGDLRGLMYGLLEAAEQIRSNGRLTSAHGAPATPIRGVRVLAGDSDLGKDSENFWRNYFRMLARNRFNRFNLVFTRRAAELEAPYERLRFISQMAAEYGLNFTLGIWNADALTPDDATLSKLLAACPSIRTVQLRVDTEHGVEFYRERVFRALQAAGRRVTLDLRGSPLDPALVRTIEDAGVPLLRPFAPWPASFEIDPPLVDGHIDAARHQTFYWIWGRLGYDPKTKLPRSANPEEYHAAAQAAQQLAAAHQAEIASADNWSYIASVSEAVHNHVAGIASAKQTPLETAALLETAAARLDKNALADFQLLSGLAREQAKKLRSSYELELSRQSGDDGAQTSATAPFLRPQFAHTAPGTIPPGRPLTLTLRITPPKDARTVRLYYRAPGSPAQFKTFEQPAAASVTFTIPASDISANWDLLYYFEILDREKSGWFEPDPLAATPYHVVRITDTQ
ncbi:MAG: hypothetical protein DMG59_08795 [Acidobacteria bacterium]|nr:MAG: hypothetical protein DMG59_08795 [Acidobacteriota bacterium]